MIIKPSRSGGEVVHTIKLKNQRGEIFYQKLTYIYLEMPNFNKLEKDLETRLDKWLYFIKNLEDFQHIPTIFKDDVFTRAFEKAELANMKQADLDQYESSLKVFRDNKATFDYAKQEAYDEGKAKGIADGIEEGKSQGIEEGKLEGKLEVARSAKQMGLSAADIAKLTGLSEEEINKL